MGREENIVKDEIIGKLIVGRDDIIAWKLANGFVRYPDGRGVRYGTVAGFPDLFGCKAVLIQPWHVGRTIGQFWTIEAKKPGPDHTSKDRKIKQANVRDSIIRLGGISGVTKTVEGARSILSMWEDAYDEHYR